MTFFRQTLLLASLILTTWLSCTTTVLAARLDYRVQALLEESDSEQTIPVIVTFRNRLQPNQLQTEPGPNKSRTLVQALKTRAEHTQAEIRKFLQSRSRKPIKDLWIINGLAIEATSETIAELRQRPEVLSIEYDRIVSLPEADITQVTSPPEPNLELINAPALWDLGFAGQGVVVAVMDSGADLNHPDLASRWRGGSNSWYDPNGEHPDLPYDNDGHGTAALGIIVGGDASGTTIGVAPEAEWIAVKLFDDEGNSRLSNIHLGFSWLLDPDGNPATDDAPDVVNNSWDFGDNIGECITEVENDIALLKEAGIAVVFAAGNSGPDPATSSSPSNNPSGFAVGSVGSFSSQTEISSFSSRGPSACDGSVYPEITAPGVFVTSAGLTSVNPYVQVSGTSFAAPHVAGVMALLLSSSPGLTPAALETALENAAVDLGDSGPDNDYGYGLVDAATAFDLLNDALLTINDPVVPPNDSQLPFGHIPVGTTASYSLNLRNSGQGLLVISGVTIAGSGAFSVIGNNCPGTLASGSSCQINIRFAPALHREEQATLQIASNSSASEITSVTLSGVGNTSPAAADLAAPANGATGLDSSVLLQWNQRPDADGDNLTHQVRYGTSADFEDVPPVEIISGASMNILLVAGSGGLFVLWPVMFRRQHWWRRAVLSLVLFILIILSSSCGGGGGSSGDGEITEQGSLLLEDLAAATTYYWQVTSSDSLGAEAESPVWNFTTR